MSAPNWRASTTNCVCARPGRTSHGRGPRISWGCRRCEEAVAHWNLAIEGAPNPRYFYQVALAQMRLGRLDSAREWIARTEERDPANADVWVGRAMLASGLDSVGVAIGYADSALARQPRKWDALELRRKLLQFRGK